MDIASLANAALMPVASVPAPQVPSDLVTERFNAMMSAGGPAPASHPALPTVSVSSMTKVTNVSDTVGSQILAGFHSASTEYAQKWKNITAELNAMGRSPSAGNMLKIQSELLQVSVQYELVGKGVSRSTQNVETLVKMS